jgi:hypothetical protein
MEIKLEKYLLFVYPAYVICFMGVIGVFVEVFFNIPTPEYLRKIFTISAVYSIMCIIAYILLSIKTKTNGN